MNETEFWDAAYRNNAPVLLGVLRRYVKEQAVAQDLLHEVFITAINKRESFTGKGSFEGWLHRIAVNTALMYLRSERGGHILVELASEPEDDVEDRQDNARNVIEAADFTDDELLAAIDRLPNHHKMVFNMYVMDDFSHKKISDELNISVGTSKSHLARARKKIQQLLYKDALNKEKTKNKKWASGFLLLFLPFNRHFIDSLYQSRLSDFKMPVPSGAEFLETAVREASTQAAVSATGATASTVFWGSKLSYMAVCAGTAAITGSTCWLAMGDNSPLNSSGSETVQEVLIDPVQHNFVVPNSVVSDSVPDNNYIHMYDVPSEETPPYIYEEDIMATDSEKTPSAEPHMNPVANETDIKPVANEPNNPDAAPAITPVMVTKQIIQHETVVIRDTIIIQE